MDRLATDLASLRFKPSIRDTGKQIAGVVASASGAHGAIMLKMSSNSAVRSAATATAAAATSGSLLVGRRWGLAYLPLLLLRLLRRPRSVAAAAAAAAAAATSVVIVVIIVTHLGGVDSRAPLLRRSRAEQHAGVGRALRPHVGLVAVVKAVGEVGTKILRN